MILYWCAVKQLGSKCGHCLTQINTAHTNAPPLRRISLCMCLTTPEYGSGSHGSRALERGFQIGWHYILMMYGYSVCVCVCVNTQELGEFVGCLMLNKYTTHKCTSSCLTMPEYGSGSHGSRALERRFQIWWHC